MKVIATDVSRRFNLRLKELHRVANPGEVFEVTEDRFVYLNGNNPNGYRVVEWYPEPEQMDDESRELIKDLIPTEEEVVEEPVVEASVVEAPVVEEPVPEEPVKKKKTTRKKSTKTKTEE